MSDLPSIFVVVNEHGFLKHGNDVVMFRSRGEAQQAIDGVTMYQTALVAGGKPRIVEYVPKVMQ